MGAASRGTTSRRARRRDGIHRSRAIDPRGLAAHGSGDYYDTPGPEGIAPDVGSRSPAAEALGGAAHNRVDGAPSAPRRQDRSGSSNATMERAPSAPGSRRWFGTPAAQNPSFLARRAPRLHVAATRSRTSTRRPSLSRAALAARLFARAACQGRARGDAADLVARAEAAEALAEPSRGRATVREGARGGAEGRGGGGRRAGADPLEGIVGALVDVVPPADIAQGGHDA